MSNSKTSSFDEGLAKLKGIENLWLRGHEDESIKDAEELCRAETTQGGDTTAIGGRAKLFIAERALITGDTFGALGALSQARDILETKTQPSSPLTGRIKALVGATYIAQKMSKEADYFFRESITRPLSPDDEDSWYLAAIILSYAPDEYHTDDLINLFAESSNTIGRHHAQFFPDAYLNVAKKCLKRQNLSLGRDFLNKIMNSVAKSSITYATALSIMQAYDSRGKNPKAVLSDALSEIHEGNIDTAEGLAIEVLPRLTESVDVIEMLHEVGLALITSHRENTGKLLLSKAYEFIHTTSEVPLDLQGEIIHNFGILSAQEGDDEKAIKLLKEALVLRTKHFGEKHESALQTKHALSIIKKSPESGSEVKSNSAPSSRNENAIQILQNASNALERGEIETAKPLIQAALALLRVG